MRISNACLKCAARGSLKIQAAKSRQNSPFAHHRTTLSGCVFATKASIDSRKNMLKSSISSTCSHNMVNFGPLAAEIGLPVCATPANFNGFRVLASLLHRRRSTDVNQTLHDVWPCHGLVHYIYIFGGLLPLRGFARCKIHFASKSCALLY